MKIRNKLMRPAAAALTLFVFVLFAAFYRATDYFRDLDGRGNDLRFRVRGLVDDIVHGKYTHTRARKDIVIVGIDEATIGLMRDKKIYWPFPWNIHATMTRYLGSGNPRSILFDVMFLDHRTYEKEFAETLRRAGTVYLSYPFVSDTYTYYKDQPERMTLLARISWDAKRIDTAKRPPLAESVIPPNPLLARAARGIGFITVFPDDDNVCRKVPLVLKHGGRYYPSIDLVMVMDYFGITADDVAIRLGERILLSNIPPDKQSMSGGESELTIPIDDRGFMTVNFAGGDGSFELASYSSYLKSGSMGDDRYVRNRIFYVGAHAKTGIAMDEMHTPFGAMYGVEIRANALNTILNGDFIVPFPHYALLLVLLLLAAVYGYLASTVTVLRYALFSTGIVLAYEAVAFGLFYWFNLVAPSASPIVLNLGIFILFIPYKIFYRLDKKQKEQIRQQQALVTALRKVDRLKDEFLANTSHELRTPLNGIIGIAESLMDGAAGELDERINANLSMIVTSGTRLSRLINDILDFSKLKQGDIALDRKSVDIRGLVRVVLALFQPMIRNKSLALEAVVGNDATFVLADEDRLQQILHNLVGNAVKFTERGRITVSVKEHRDRGVAEIAVADTGIGIPGDRLGDIFKSFEQVDAAIEREYGGTGLGLAVTKKLVELHGGTITVSSEPGKGSVFTVSLPTTDEKPARDDRAAMPVSRIALYREGGDESGDVSAPSSPQLRGIGKGEMHVLIVDDEPINLQVLANQLANLNYRVTRAASGREALELFEREDIPDLVLLDIMMPRMSGFEVCKKIRERHSSGELPVIMVTAKNQVGDLVQSLSIGANDFLSKPFSKGELYARINTHLKVSKINVSYARFVPMEFMKFLEKESIIDVTLGDHVEKVMTILFSDIRSFTTLSESMTPDENFDFINSYLRNISPIIRDNNGFIDKYIGDAIMALFPYSPEDALVASIAMHKRLSRYNEEQGKKGYPSITIGIGLHTGTLMLGTIGEDKRMEGTVISDSVNLASRMEGLTKLFGASIIISGDTLKGLADPGRYHYRYLGNVKVKGKNVSVPIYDVYDGDGDDIIEKKNATREDFERGIALYYRKAFSEAGIFFEKVRGLLPDDAATKFFLEQTIIFMASGVPENWDGTASFDSKF